MSLNELFTRNVYWPLVQKVKREHAARALAELSESQWKSQEELLSRQWQLVLQVVRKAAQEVPYYRKMYADMNLDVNKEDFSYEDFLHIPKIEKETLRDNLTEFFNPNYKGRITEGRTSGSTGLSLKLYYDGQHESYSEAARWRAKEWWEVRPGSAHVAIWGRPYTGFRDRLEQKLKSYCMNTLLISAFDLHPETLGQIWQKISRFRPHIIYGYPSAIATLATFLRENRLSADQLGIKVVIITAESATSLQRDLIEEVFGCKTANEYGCSETGGFVYECPWGGWHVSSELTFIEFLDQEGKPVSSGETGEIVVTHLRNNYMPLIRYRVGDTGSPQEGICGCGRGLPLMKLLSAKERDFIRLANGKYFTSEILVYITRAVIKKYPSSILQFKAVQKNYHLLELEIVAGPAYLDEAETLFKNLLSAQIGNEISIHFKLVSSIKREPSGKLRYFISEIGQSEFTS
jgi:phenylacetate-CoA ligase